MNITQARQVARDIDVTTERVRQANQRLKKLTERMPWVEREIRPVTVILDQATRILAGMTPEITDVQVDTTDPKLRRMYERARIKILAADGEWLSWRDFRIAYRDREEYTDPLWAALAADSDIEVHPKMMKARYNPIL